MPYMTIRIFSISWNIDSVVEDTSWWLFLSPLGSCCTYIWSRVKNGLPTCPPFYAFNYTDMYIYPLVWIAKCITSCTCSFQDCCNYLWDRALL